VSDQRGCSCFPFLCHLCPQLLLSASAASWLLHSFFFCGLCAVVLLLMLAFSHQCGATHPEVFFRFHADSFVWFLCVQSLPRHFISLCADLQTSPSATDESSRASTASADIGGAVRQVAGNDCCMVKSQWLVAPSTDRNWVQHTVPCLFISKAFKSNMCNFNINFQLAVCFDFLGFVGDTPIKLLLAGLRGHVRCLTQKLKKKLWVNSAAFSHLEWLKT
jgi:hypothetical protein